MDRELRPGLTSCVIKHLMTDQASYDPLQGVNGRLTLRRSATPRLDAAMQAWELTATFRTSAGKPWNHVWAIARYGRVIFVLHGFWFLDGYGTPVNPRPLLINAIRHTPAS